MNAAGIAGRRHAVVAALRRVTSAPPPLSRWAWTADAILALVLAAGALNGALSRGRGGVVPVPVTGVPQPPLPPLPPPAAGLGAFENHGAAAHWQLALAVLTALPLAARRRYPLAVFWAVIGATLLYHLGAGFDPFFTFVSCVIAGYGAVLHSPYRALALASALVGAALIVADHQAVVPALGPGTAALLILVPAGLAANAIHTWKQRVRTLEADRADAMRRAVERERSRIAQELHDVVTHNVSMMVIQAGAARKVMDAAPEKAQRALLSVESVGRAAMTELRHVMGLLTMNGDDPDQTDVEHLAPPPGLGQVAELAARVRDTGVAVELAVTGAPATLPAGVELAAYRVVQEALTNVVKHAGGARVTIAIAYAPRVLTVEVTDTGGTPTASARSGSGRGLIGLRERLAVYGGDLDAGALPVAGYRVRAMIPLEER